ncbi:MAG: phage integrase N-terminal SAM-like domain-containing protein [Fibrobacterota bacterium]
MTQITAKGFSKNTARNYCSAVNRLASRFPYHPGKIKPGDLSQYITELIEKYADKTVNLHIEAIKSFYTLVLKDPEKAEDLQDLLNLRKLNRPILLILRIYLRKTFSHFYIGLYIMI